MLVRYADDLMVLCPTKERAEAALRAVTAILASLGLALTEGKVQIVDLRRKGQGVDFLGFHHRRVESFTRKGRYFCARWPSAKAVRAARRRTRELTARKLLLLPVGEIVGRVNEYLRGWSAYFGRGNSTAVFHDLDCFVLERVARFISRKHGHSGPGYGFAVLRRNRYLGLHRLVGTVWTGPAHAAR